MSAPPAGPGSLSIESACVQIYLHFPSLSVSSSSDADWGAMGLYAVVEGDANYAVIKKFVYRSY